MDYFSFIFSPLFLKIIIVSIIGVFVFIFLTNFLSDENYIEKTGEELFEEFEGQGDVENELKLGDMLKNGYETFHSPIFPSKYSALVHYQRIIQHPKIKEDNPFVLATAIERTHEIIEQETQERRRDGENIDDIENIHFQVALIDDARTIAHNSPPIKIGEKTTFSQKSKKERAKPKPQIVHDNDIQKAISKIYNEKLKKYKEKAKFKLSKYLKSEYCQKETCEIINQIIARNQKLTNLDDTSESEVIGCMIAFIEKESDTKEQKKDLYDALRQNINDCKFKDSTIIQCATGIVGKIISTIQIINPENTKTRISTFWETYELIKNKCGKIMLEEKDEEKAKEKIKKMIKNECVDTKILTQQKGEMITNEMLSAF